MLTIDPKHRLVEGVASDGTTIWVSSILDRQILACARPAGRWRRCPRRSPVRDRLGRAAKRLWVAADCPPGVAGDQGVRARRADRARHAAGGSVTRIAPVVGAASIPATSRRRDGSVFVSDSQNGMVFRLLPERPRRSWRSCCPGVGKSAQGTALDARRQANCSSPITARASASVDLATVQAHPAAAAGRQAVARDRRPRPLRHRPITASTTAPRRGCWSRSR